MDDVSPKVHRSPRMSVNALAQYLSASATQRETILRNQKYPPDYRTIWYKEATAAVVRYLLDSERDEEILVRTIDRLYATGSTEHEQKRLKSNAEALEGFLRGHDDIVFDSLSIERGPKSAMISIEGVSVSVRPEVSLKGSYRGNRVQGGIRLYFSKSQPLTDDSAGAIGALVYRSIDESVSRSVSVSRRHCQVIDVYAGEVFPAPTAIVRRMRDLEAACREIALRWPTIRNSARR